MVAHRTMDRVVQGSIPAVTGNWAFSLSSLSYLSISPSWRWNTTGFQLSKKMESLAVQRESKQAIPFNWKDLLWENSRADNSKHGRHNLSWRTYAQAIVYGIRCLLVDTSSKAPFCSPTWVRRAWMTSRAASSSLSLASRFVFISASLSSDWKPKKLGIVAEKNRSTMINCPELEVRLNEGKPSAW